MIVTDSPDTNWNPRGEDPRGEDEAEPLILPAATLPTLGQALLSKLGAGEYRSGIKVVLVSTPRIPEHYELIRR